MVTGSSNQLHVVFIPALATGHIIPLVQIARLFAARGVRSTIITTVHNALKIQPSIDHDIDRGYPLTIRTVNFPASKVGLPTGVENISACTNTEMALALIHGQNLLRTPMEQFIRDVAPDCIFSDMFITWTVDLAEELNIPRLLFYPNNFFYHSVSHSLRFNAPHANVKSEFESFEVPNLPDNIRMKSSQISQHLRSKTQMGDIMERVQESEKRSHGLVHNTFYEIEPAYADHVKNIKGTKIWHIGPVFQFFKHHNSDGDGGVVSEKHSCLTWLDDQKPKSVTYVCFGSLVRFPEAQITEIASALEESKQPFIWVVRKEGNEGIGGLPEGFEERVSVENKGLVITGWAPQVEILQHPSLCGFLTHCGWNSVLEAVTAGVPLMTWPLYAEQFYNEKLVELLGIGVGVGAEVWNPSFEITSPIIGKRAILKAIELLTGESTIAENIRQNSKELALKAKKVVEEGGSSLKGLNDLIDELKTVKFSAKH